MLNPLDRDAGPLVDWDTIGQPEFDRLIEALVPYQHPDGSDVQAINGRGGDGGRDVVVTEPDGRKIIYQLKCFPEGFDGKHAARRKQISNPAKNPRDRGSLQHALEHHPDEWILVAPCNPSVSGWAWIEKLKREHKDRVKITFVGRAQLDGHKWCAGHQGIVRALHSRDEMLTKAAILNQEKAVLAHAGDLADRVQALGGVADDVDPAWTWDFARVGDLTVQTLRAKHPSAQLTNPITGNFTVAGSHDELSAFAGVLDYGSFTPIRIPGEMVTGFRMTGSQLVELDELESTLTALELHPEVHIPEERQASIRLLDEAGHPISTNSGIVPRVSRGARGLTFEHVLYGALTMTWRVPADQGTDGSVSTAFDSGRAADASFLLRAIKLDRDLTRAATVELRGRNTTLVRAGLTLQTGAVVDAESEERRAFIETVDDLAYVQQATDTFFPVPESITGLDRVWLRVLRRALEGRMCFAPDAWTTLNMTIGPAILGGEGPELLLAGDSAMLLVSQDSSSVEWADHELHLPKPLAFVLRSATLQDAAAVRSRLEHGESVAVVIKSNRDAHPVVYMPSRVTEGTRLVPEPWGLTGIEEVPEVDQLGDDEVSGPVRPVS